MPVGQNTRELGRIDPQSLIGNADPNIVSPRATSALIDAFRNGFITADDIISRVGTLGKAKEKAELTLNQEAVSPAAVAARQQAQAAGTAADALALAQAKADMKNVGPAADLEGQQIGRKMILVKYPGVIDFEKLAPAAGVAPVLKPDGTPDWARMSVLGAELKLHSTRKAAAKEKLEDIVRDKTSDGSTMFPATKQGRPVDTQELARLEAQANAPFVMMEAGQTQTAPTTTGAAAPTAKETPEMEVLRALAVENAAAANPGRPLREIILETQQAPAQEVLAQIAPSKAAAAAAPQRGATPALGTPVAGGFSLGIAPTAHRATEAQQKAQTALARFDVAGDQLQALRDGGFDPTTISSWLDSKLPEWLKSGDRKQFDSAASAWIQGLLRLESGAAIAAHEQRWYEKAFFPQVGDPESVLQSKQALRNGLEEIIGEQAMGGGVASDVSEKNIRNIRERVLGLRAQAEQLVPPATVRSDKQPSGVIVLKSGKRVQRNSQGNLVEID